MPKKVLDCRKLKHSEALSAINLQERREGGADNFNFIDFTI